MPQPHRPVGIVLIVIADSIYGVVMLLAGIAGIFTGQVASGLPRAFFPAEMPVMIIILSLIAMAFGILALAVAYGMWTIQSWGYTLQKALCILDGLVNLSSLLFQSLTAASILSFVGLGIDIVILLYIFQPSIRESYETERRA